MILWREFTMTRITLRARHAKSSSVARAPVAFSWYASWSDGMRFASSMREKPTRKSAIDMKKRDASEASTDEMRPHYDFDYDKSRPNRFASRLKLGRVRSVVLEPDVAEVFRSSDEVNDLLRSIITKLPDRPASGRR